MYDYKKILEELKQGSSKKESASNIGAIIRGARIERKMTQGEVAKGICSVSYLSKIENGLYDMKNAYVQEIMHRMDIKVDRHHTMDHTGIVNDVLMAVYHRDNVKLQSMRLRFDKPVVPAEWLVELANHVLAKEEDKPAIAFLNQNRRVLGKEELYLFLLLLAMHELQAYRISEVAKLVDFLDMAHDEIPPYSVMSHYLLGRYYLLNGQYSPASHEFSTVLGLHGSVMRDAWRVDIMNNLLLVFVFGNELHSAERIVKKLVQLPSGSEWEEYALGYYYLKKKEFDKALKSFLQAKELHFAPSMLGIVECCYLAGWHEKMRDYYHILNEIAPGSFFEKIANMFLLVPGHDLIPLKDYVTHILQPQFRLFGFYYYKHNAVTYLQEYFRTISRYKQVDLLRLEK
jgi:HTH-type transcriptional regulator, quorum sensing regulator NprR